MSISCTEYAENSNIVKIAVLCLQVSKTNKPTYVAFVCHLRLYLL